MRRRLIGLKWRVKEKQKEAEKDISPQYTTILYFILFSLSTTIILIRRELTQVFLFPHYLYILSPLSLTSYGDEYSHVPYSSLRPLISTILTIYAHPITQYNRLSLTLPLIIPYIYSTYALFQLIHYYTIINLMKVLYITITETRELFIIRCIDTLLLQPLFTLLTPPLVLIT